LEELIEQQPESADLNYLLGDTLLNLQQVEDALPLLKKAVALSPRFGSAHASLGRAYLQIGDAKSAVPHLKAALDTDRDGALHYQIAHAYQMTGQQELAQVALKEYQKLQQAAAEEKESAEKEVKILPPEPASTGARVRAPQAPDQP
jgi:predicted Zn-dependent protease